MELFKNIFFNTDKIIGKTDIKLTYAGKLFQDGVQSVLVHYGYGDNWDYAGDIQMEKTELGYQANIYVQDAQTLNFCFKGINGEWDNNNGQNYTFQIEAAEVVTPVENTVEEYNYTNAENTEVNQTATEYVDAGVNENTSLITPTPTWGELIKKTFHNIVNYFSKLFAGKKENVNNNNN